ncbi:MAG TPA: SGNH/GDSL hydrolase family protein, partial [Bacteroidota bacterium]|nr:SGNH/GDSL hydrolase family protein [Bacteroidota bacterium]
MKASSVTVALIALVLAALIGSCTDKAPGPVAGLGSLSVKSYVSVGNSLTAGYQSNGLYESSQIYSFPNLIAREINASGGSITFVQPLWSDPGTPIAGTNIASRYEILSLVGPKIGPAGRPAGAPENLAYAAPYNNLGIPGAFIYDFLNARDSNTCYSALGGQKNPLFTSTLRGIGTQFQQMRALRPDLVTFWLGNNDVLGFATSGGLVPVTNPAVFDVLYKASLDSLRAAIGQSAALVVANVPDVTSIPFFKTIPSQ